MAQHSTDAMWQEIDPTTLPEGHKLAYDNYKAQYKVMKECREQFEQGMQLGVPEGSRMVFGYRFGKLSVAIVPDDRKPAKAKASSQSLADFLKAMAQGGHRC